VSKLPDDFVAVDPGKHACGVAVFIGGTLRGAYYPRTMGNWGRVEQWRQTANAVLLDLRTAGYQVRDLALVCEVPKARKERTDAADDLLDLTGVLGALVGSFRIVLWDPRPEEWKGQVPKEVTHRRLEKIYLTDAEKFCRDQTLRAVPPSLRHNALDAIALGVEYLRREGFRK
jgi:hypothetical protein